MSAHVKPIGKWGHEPEDSTALKSYRLAIAIDVFSHRRLAKDGSKGGDPADVKDQESENALPLSWTDCVDQSQRQMLDMRQKRVYLVRPGRLWTLEPSVDGKASLLDGLGKKTTQRVQHGVL